MQKEKGKKKKKFTKHSLKTILFTLVAAQDKSLRLLNKMQRVRGEVNTSEVKCYISPTLYLLGGWKLCILGCFPTSKSIK